MRLLQRASLKSEFNPEILTGQYLSLDYMGSSEFEFGAVPQFQRDIQPLLKSMSIYSLSHNNTVLYYACLPANQEKYEIELKLLIDQKLVLKERSGLTEKEVTVVKKGKKQTWVYDSPEAPYKFNVWLDLNRNSLICRDEQVLKNLFVSINNSVTFMNSKK